MSKVKYWAYHASLPNYRRTPYCPNGNVLKFSDTTRTRCLLLHYASIEKCNSRLNQWAQTPKTSPFSWEYGP